MKTTACLLFLLFPFITNAQPGTLDQSFGDSGIVVDKKVFGIINAIALQSDGKIVAAGSMTLNSRDPLLVARYNGDGSIDESFGTNGFTGANELSKVFGIAVQKDDAIIALGHTASDIKLAKYKKDGRLDSSFGYNGVIITSVGNTDEPADIAIQPDGKIVVGGYIINAENQDRQGFLVRYLPDGSLDESFGKGGILIFDSVGESGNIATVNAIALQKDGKIVAATTGFFKPYVYRFNVDGSIDKSFGNNGEAYFQSSTSKYNNGKVYDISVREDGKIVGGGEVLDRKRSDLHYMSVMRINADGSIDSIFGQNGLQYVLFANENSTGKAILLQGDGKIICTGNTYNSDVALARLNEDGQLDSTFGVNGQTRTDAEGATGAKSAALQKDGKIVLGGYAFIGGNFDGFYYNLLARYNGDKDKQPLAIRIKRWLQHHGISWQYNGNVRYYAVQRSTDGGITYQEVAKVNAGNRPVYNYEDASAPANNSNTSYRLAAIAKDGSRTYSNTILIDEAQSARIYPNPVRDNLQLQGLPTTGKTNVSVMDLNGNIRSMATATGTNYSVSTANLSSGSYLLKIQHNGTTTTQPFVKE